MSEQPTIETLFRQAPMTAHTYLNDAIDKLDLVFGQGYARDHPELVSAYMQTCAIDYHAGVLARIEWQLGQLVDGIHGIELNMPG
jgi:hypothetical protein